MASPSKNWVPIANTMLTTTPASRRIRWRTVQIEKNNPATASAYSAKPGSSVISGCQGSVARASACAPPHTRDSAGAMKKPFSGGENIRSISTVRRASGCWSATVR